jgi:hypothetical protein
LHAHYRYEAGLKTNCKKGGAVRRKHTDNQAVAKIISERSERLFAVEEHIYVA